MDSLFKLLETQPFLQSVILLFLTALVTGVGVPVVTGLIDDRKLRQQKLFEADLARQSKVIDAQGKLLDDLTSRLWKIQKGILAVSYYKTEGEEELYKKKYAEYHENSWLWFGDVVVLISESRRLASVETYRKLKELYEQCLEPFDQRLTKLAKRSDATGAEWDRFHEHVRRDMSDKIEEALSLLAQEFRLAGNGNGGQPR